MSVSYFCGFEQKFLQLLYNMVYSIIIRYLRTLCVCVEMGLIMKKIKIIIPAVILAFVLAGCSTAVSDKKESSSISISENSAVNAADDKQESGSSSESSLISVADNVCFREGESIDGSVIVTSKDIAGFYPGQGQPGNNLIFTMTARGAQLISDETKKLAEEDGVLSLWVGNEKVASPKVKAQIIDGKMSLFSALNDEDFKTLCNKLQGK